MREFYNRLLEAIAAEHERIREPLVTAFWPMVSSATDGKLLLVGRAVNGWDDGFAPSALLNSEVRATAIERCRLASAGEQGRDPMLWVTDYWGSGREYNTKRSSFWCIARAAVGQLGLGDVATTSWPSSIDWTNLYKVSPQGGRNPSPALERAQSAACRDLLAVELDSSPARAALFLTGWDWAGPFLPGLEEVSLSASNRYVERAGTLSRREGARLPAVIAKHPERKPREPFAAELAGAWQACGVPLQGIGS